MSEDWELKICCMGAGYVGGPTMAVIAKQCPKVSQARTRDIVPTIRMTLGKNNSELSLGLPSNMVMVET